MAIDLYTPEFQADPYPAWRELRENAPVYREPRFGAWVLTRFEDVYGALRDHGTYSSAYGVGPGPMGTAVAANATIVTSDPPKHTQLRNLVNRAFTPRTVAALSPRMEGIVTRLLSEREGDVFDFVQTLSYPLPVIVIAELLGIPPEKREDFKRWSDALVGTFEAELRPELMAVVGEMLAYISGVVAERKAAPQEDLISALTEAEIDGQRLTDPELISFALILLVAGNETTTNLLGNLLNFLVDRPDLWARLREDRSLVEPAIEEILRFDSPVQVLGRRLMRDVELHGVQMREGDRVMVAFGAANRDEAEFPHAETFDLDRDLSRHLAFGHGIHYCLGSPLARSETRIALNALLDTFATIERPAPGTRTHSTVIHGFHALPLAGRP